MKSLPKFFAVFLIASMLLVACGQAVTPVTEVAQPEPTKAPTEAPAAPEPTAVPAVVEPTKEMLPVGSNAWAYDPNPEVNNGEPMVLKIWSADENWQKHFQKWADEYTKIHPNITFEYSFTPWGEYWTKLPLAISTGEGPDVFHFHNAYTVQFLENGLIAPYPDGWIPQLKEDFNQLEAHVIDGKLYYFDYGVMTGVIWYNKAAWSEAGLTDSDIPTTWEQVTEIAKKLTKYDASGKVSVQGFGLNGSAPSLWTALTYQMGSYQFTADGKSVINDAAKTEALQMIYDWYYTDKVASPDFPDTYQSLADGSSAMGYEWAWVGSYAASQSAGVELGSFKMPTISGQLTPAYDANNGESTPGVNPKISDARKAVAYDYLHFLLDNEQATIDLSLMAGISPVMKRIMDNPALDANPITKLSAEIGPYTIWMGPKPLGYDSNLLPQVMGDGLKIGQSVDEIIASWAEKTNALLAESTTVYWGKERAYLYNSEMLP